MADTEHVSKWRAAAETEIRTLERMGTWVEVPQTEATSKILPGTWAYRRKRSPDGEIKKYKARYCVRGDLQEGVFNTYSPLVSWSTVRVLLAFALTFGWTTCSIDFASAFVQAKLKDPVWIHLPRGFRSSKGDGMCLRLVKSLYGLSVAPRLWFEHLRDGLLAIGLIQSKYDQCLFYGPDILVACYSDDLPIVAKNEAAVERFLSALRARGFEFTKEEGLFEYLGIKLERNDEKKTFTLTQTGLIDKIAAVTGLENCSYNRVPTTQLALGSDPDGKPMKENWGYASVVGMLLYLSTNTRPDIAFGVSQVARFTSNPKQSHATAVKMIIRYLVATRLFGMIIQPRLDPHGALTLDLFVDADFVSLYKREPDWLEDSVHSRTGYIETFCEVPLLWKSFLQTEISLSTLEAEYAALSNSLKSLLPLKRLIEELISVMQLPKELGTTVKARAFEDNQGAYYLATNQRITNRTKYFLLKFHWFCSHYNKREFKIYKIDTKDQKADYLTKGLDPDAFEANRKAVQGW
jgi:hypothetical protein